MTLNNKKCNCQKRFNDQEDDLLKELEFIRERCPAIRLVYLPDDVWPCYKCWHRRRDLHESHQSILLLALKRDLLTRVTSAVHRFLISEGSIHSKVSDNYKKDLREKWWKNPRPLGWHGEFRSFMGRLAELQFAEWLEQQGWSIESLEALGGQVDIAASATEGIAASFEVKYIGTQDDVFKTLQEAIKDPGGISGGSLSLYAAVNYLQFRVYEAARQLESTNGYRIAAIIISDMMGFEQPLSDKWIDWNEPYFRRGDTTWDNFFERRRSEKRYERLPDNLSDKIQILHAIWILEWTSDYQLRVEDKIRV